MPFGYTAMITMEGGNTLRRTDQVFECSPSTVPRIPRPERAMELKLTDLIGRAPWREAVTYRDTWPHEYVLSERDGQQELLAAIWERFRAGEGVACRFFTMNNTYLFIGDHKYWLMTHWEELEPGVNYVINRARLYRDRRDFVIQLGDTGKPEDYPVSPPYESQSSLRR